MLVDDGGDAETNHDSQFEMAAMPKTEGSTRSPIGNGSDERYAGDEPIENGHHHDPLHNNGMPVDDHEAVDSMSDFWDTLAGIVGNVLEWFDFAVFGFLADEIGQVFFPSHQKEDTAITESFLVFGLAFLMRPVGGIVMGYIGDTYGRKKALVISIYCMAFPTFAMGCLPTYDQVGDLAIVLLVLVRLMQGFSVGGQLMSSAVYTLEGHEAKHWGYYGSLVMAAANFGTLLGSFACFLQRLLLTDQQLSSWGWRLPFLSGILVSISGFYLKGHDEAHMIEKDANVPTNPLKLAFARHNLRSLLASAMVPMLWSSGFYLSFVWMAIYMTDLIDNPVPGSFGVNAGALFFSVCLLFPVAGICSDRYGRRRVMTIGGLSMGILCPFLIFLIGQGNTAVAFLSQCTIGVCLSCWGAPMIAWLVESFEPEARLTSVAIGYNLAQALIGGLTPALATFIVESLGPSAPGFLFTALAALSLTGLWFVAPTATTPALVPSDDDAPHDGCMTPRPTGSKSGTRRRKKEVFSFVPNEDHHEHSPVHDDDDMELI